MLSYNLGNYNIFIVYTVIDKLKFFVRNGISTPFVILKNKLNNYHGQILRDIDFSFSFKPHEMYLIHVFKVNAKELKTVNHQKKFILNQLKTNNYSNVLLSHKINYEDLFIDECIKRYNIKKKIFDKNIVYNILIKYLPLEIIKRICGYIDDTLEINLVLHEGISNPNHIYVSNPSIYFPNFLSNKLIRNKK